MGLFLLALFLSSAQSPCPHRAVTEWTAFQTFISAKLRFFLQTAKYYKLQVTKYVLEGTKYGVRITNYGFRNSDLCFLICSLAKKVVLLHKKNMIIRNRTTNTFSTQSLFCFQHEPLARRSQ